MCKSTLFLAVAMLVLASQALAQDSSNVRTVGFYDTPGVAYDVAISGSYAYVADYDAGLRIIDISDPTSPTEAGFYTTPLAFDVAVSGSYAYLADGNALRIIDISNPASPVEVGYYYTLLNYAEAHGIAVSGSYAYIAGGEYNFHGYHYGYLLIIDISAPTSPSFTSTCNTPGYAKDVAVSGSYAYVADGWLGLRIIDINNPASPFESGSYRTPDPIFIHSVAISGCYAYVAASYIGLRIIDISDPASPAEVGFYDTPGIAHGVAVSGNYAYVADYSSGLRIIDIRNPASPAEAGFYDTPGVAEGVAVFGSLVYVADGDSGLRIYQGYGPAGVEAGQGSPSEYKVESLKLKVAGCRIEYQVPMDGRATIKVYNLLGQEVRTLVDEVANMGTYKVSWDGREQGGRRVASGVYLVRLQAGEQAATAKAVVIR